MQKEFDVIALGELLIDFTMHGESEQGNNLFEACPGGAPCNVLAMLNKLGKKTAFLGKVGQDQFGTLLKATLDDVGIDTSALYMDQEVNTTLAFVHTFPDGDREFSFYRNPGADMMLTADEVDEEFVKKAKIFHFGTLSMTHDGVREATKKALKIAKDNGLVITFDPNLRPPLWSSLELAKEQMEYGFAYCDVLKISDNEIQFISGKEDYDEGIRYLQEKYQIPLILLTMGKDGSRAYYKDMRVEVAGRVVKAIETTGAGDTFCGSSINYVLEHGLENLTEENLKEMLSFANAAAALITTKKGAIRSMPEKEDVRGLIFDIDNTLVPHGAPADERAKALFARLKAIGFSSCLISNNQEPRVKMFNEEIQTNYIFNAHKPSTKNYKKGMEIMGTTPENTIFIGDQLFTDVYGAKRAGIRNILVKPIHPKEEIQIVLKRYLEKIVLHFYRKEKDKRKK